MTALDRYQRLESGGVWREATDAQRRDVILSFGDASLVISDKAGRPLTHWSLPAVLRQNPGERPAVYTPSEDASEVVEIAEETMINAIEEVRKALAKKRPQPGKLRHLTTAGLVLLGLGLAVFWLPGALARQTLAVVPFPKRVELGATILGHMQAETGSPCREGQGAAALDRLTKRLFGADTTTQVIIVPELQSGTVALPGGLILLGNDILYASDDPAVAAGYLLVAETNRRAVDPLKGILQDAGLSATFQLLTTGDIPAATLKDAAKLEGFGMMESASQEAIAATFLSSQVHSAPYAAVALARGETPKIGTEDQTAERDFPPVLGDADWVSLQNICNT